MYIPFARKYRPRYFREVIGQDVPVRIIKNAVKGGKVANAYLFAGPRGVGKTTVARILAKALNCMNPSDGEPCGECENCLEIDRGSFPDLIEMDAASNRGIDDIRAIREAVSYTPIKGRFKVYIIDEAHMLTKEAFNALLKTLEEPPPRTVFILCTTEYEKIIPTILSRCQRIVFSRVNEDDIVLYLKGICSRENIECEEEALRFIARASEGSLRDSASLLDQASTLGDNRITSEIVEESLGVLSTAKIKELIKCMLDSDVDGALNILRKAYYKGYNLSKVWDTVEEELRNAILVKSLRNPSGIVDEPHDYEEFLSYPLEALLYLETVVNRGKLDARTRTPLRAYELAIIKSSLIKDIVPISEIIKGGLISQEIERVEEVKSSKEKSLEDEIRKRLTPLARKAIDSSKVVKEGEHITFIMDEGTYDAFRKEFEKLRREIPQVEFKLEKKKDQKRDSASLF